MNSKSLFFLAVVIMAIIMSFGNGNESTSRLLKSLNHMACARSAQICDEISCCNRLICKKGPKGKKKYCF
jgi:hypothetical protein